MLPYKNIVRSPLLLHFVITFPQIMELFQDRLMDMALTVTQPHQKLVRMPL